MRDLPNSTQPLQIRFIQPYSPRCQCLADSSFSVVPSVTKERKKLLKNVCGGVASDPPVFIQEPPDDYLTWTLAKSISGKAPPGLQGPAIVLDAAHARTLVFGGCDPGRTHGGCTSGLWAHHLGDPVRSKHLARPLRYSLACMSAFVHKWMIALIPCDRHRLLDAYRPAPLERQAGTTEWYFRRRPRQPLVYLWGGRGWRLSFQRDVCA